MALGTGRQMAGGSRSTDGHRPAYCIAMVKSHLQHRATQDRQNPASGYCRSPIRQCDTISTACPKLDALSCRRRAGSGKRQAGHDCNADVLRLRSPTGLAKRVLNRTCGLLCVGCSVRGRRRRLSGLSQSARSMVSRSAIHPRPAKAAQWCTFICAGMLYMPCAAHESCRASGQRPPNTSNY